MPCIGGSSIGEELGDAQAEISKLQGMLCDACSKILDDGRELPGSCKSWYARHEKEEAARLKERALAKLTVRERRLLGLK